MILLIHKKENLLYYYSYLFVELLIRNNLKNLISNHILNYLHNFSLIDIYILYKFEYEIFYFLKLILLIDLIDKLVIKQFFLLYMMDVLLFLLICFLLLV